MRNRVFLHGLFILSCTFFIPISAIHNISIAAIFESSEYKHYSEIFYKAISVHQKFVNGVKLDGVALLALDNLYESIQGICSVFERRNIVAFIVVGSKETINAITLISEPLGIPILGYIEHDTDIFEFSKLPSSLYIRLTPSWRYMARGLTRFFHANFWFNYLLYIEDVFLFDGFYDELHSITHDARWEIREEIFSKKMSDAQFDKILKKSVQNQHRIIVLHASVYLAQRIFKRTKRMFKDVYIAWFMTERAYTVNKLVTASYPEGSLALLMNDAININDLLQDSISMVSSVFLKFDKPDSDMFSSLKYDCSNPSSFNAFAGQILYRELIRTRHDGLKGVIEFDLDGAINCTNFEIRSLVKTGKNKKVWRDMGYIRGDDIYPFGIVWPGESISNQMINGKKRYRIVTNPVKPFVMEQEPNKDYDSCGRDTVCLKIFTKDKLETINVIRDYEQHRFNESNPFEIRCCRGLAIDLLNRLSRDLEFDYTLYIVHDITYGKVNVNGSWNGMVHDLMTGTAHMAVGAFSITRSRLKVIDFTHPYFFSGFSVLYTEPKRHTNMLAFLEPFSVKVWLAIFISATVGAVAMALFEWNSPFGLNPWGRKRKQNYTLASGLTMVYSVLFGHTVRTKSPKSWPSKVMQNFWAFACIFVIASYTANLAAFIAGKHAGINYNDIYDSRLLDIRVGVLEASAVEAIIKKINVRLFLSSQKHYVPKTDKAIEMLIEGKIDAYLGDYPILEFARGNLDPNCQLRLLSQTFGEDGYGIGIAKDSPLKVPLSDKIKEYHDIGFIEDLIDVHFADAECYKQRITSEESSLEVQHHAGLFVMLSVGILVGILLLLFEHGIFKFCVPKLRKMNPKSCMKSTHLLFFSQRLYRIITAAELVSANESAKEMIGIVKNREFSKLFMKSTIRKSRLADMAKTKRLNRNFLDVVEKAKWMQEMRDKNLFGDDESPNAVDSCITEISLKDLCTKIDFNALKSQTYKIDVEEDGGDDDNPGNWFLGDSEDCDSKGANLRRLSSMHKGICSSLPEIEEKDIVYEPVITRQEDEYQPKVECEEEDSEGNESDSAINEQTELINHDRIDSVPGAFGELPNGHVPYEHSQSNKSPDGYKYPQAQLNDSSDDKTITPSSSIKRSSSFLRRRENENARSHSKKRKSWAEPSMGRRKSDNILTYNDITKDELLLMWKASELSLGNRLDKALREKTKLEKKIAELDERNQGIV